MSTPVVVPDASVLLKWVLKSTDEEDAERALAIRDAWFDQRVEIVVPTLWVFEVGNVLGLKRPATAPALLRGMLDLALPEAPADTYAEAIVEMMKQYDVTFYDAAYHALAIARRGTMVTADGKYAKKAGKAGRVQQLSSWTGPAVSRKP